jgi:hypothetical protein
MEASGAEREYTSFGGGGGGAAGGDGIDGVFRSDGRVGATFLGGGLEASAALANGEISASSGACLVGGGADFLLEWFCDGCLLNTGFSPASHA